MLAGLVLSLSVLYSSVFTFAKVAMDSSSPSMVNATRMILAAFVLLLLPDGWLGLKRQLPRTSFKPMLLYAFFSVYLANALEFWGLQYMTAGKACFLFSFCPIASGLIARFWFKERLTTLQWASLVWSMLSFAPILFIPSESDIAASLQLRRATLGAQLGSSFAWAGPELAMLGAATSLSLGWLAMQQAVRQSVGTATNLWGMFIGGGMTLIHLWILQPDPRDWIQNHAAFWPSELLLLFVSNLLAYNLNTWLLNHYSATRIALLGLSQPFLAALIAWVWKGETVNWSFWVSLVGVSVGLALFFTQKAPQSAASGLIGQKPRQGTVLKKGHLIPK